jgi:hypothetical protein
MAKNETQLLAGEDHRDYEARSPKRARIEIAWLARDHRLGMRNSHTRTVGGRSKAVTHRHSAELDAIRMTQLRH